MKTHNIRLKMPKINPQSNPNQFVVKNVRNSPRGGRNNGRQREGSRNTSNRDENGKYLVQNA